MDYYEFYARFGGSYRTAHLSVSPVGSVARLVRRPRSPRLIAARVLGRVTYSPRLTLAAWNGRPWDLPRRSELPAEFIRLDPWEGEYLFAVAARARSGIVETGRFRGGSTFLLACANPVVPIVSIDIAPQDDARLEAFFAERGVGGNVRLVVGDSRVPGPEVEAPPDLVFIDGDHSYDGVSGDLAAWYPKLAPGAHLLLHDCYLGNEVQEAVVDFAAEHDVIALRSPFIHAFHWQTDAGSLAHFVKRS